MKDIIIKILKSRILQSIVVVIFLCFFLSMIIYRCERLEQKVDNYEILSDSLTHYKNKHGEDVARINVLECKKNEDFLKLKTKDSTIKELQSLVKEHNHKIKDNGIATIIHTETTIHDTIPVIYRGDTVFFDEENEWLTLYGQIIKDSLSYYLLINNKFKMITGEEGGKKYSEFICENPYTSTSVLRVYQNIPKKKRFVLSAGGGAGAGIDALSGRFCIPIFLGISLGVKILEF